MYENQTFDVIMDRLLEQVPNQYDKREGSFIWDALAPVALELMQAYAELDRTLQLAFAATTFGSYLDMRAAEHGLTRKPATKAKGYVHVKGTAGTMVAKNTIFTTMNGIQYVTTEEAVVGDEGEALIPVEAVEPGAAGNVPAHAIVVIPVSLTGISEVTNPAPTEGGTDQESDADLLKRLLFKVRNPATSGNANHYKQWALEVPGVGDAIVIPLWNGPGTVKIVLLDANKRTPSPSIVDAARLHIEEVRPILGGELTVDGAVEVPIDISASLQLVDGTTIEEVQGKIELAIADYLETLAFKDPYVRYTRIANLLLDIPDVIDYADLLINGNSSNIELEPGQVAVLGSVTINAI
jgi:uncharacterized phage protein gp47/JayE